MRIEIIKEALSISGGLFSMNAAGAKYYAFCFDSREITYGEFLWSNEGEPSADKFDGYVDLSTGKVFSLIGGEHENIHK